MKEVFKSPNKSNKYNRSLSVGGVLKLGATAGAIASIAFSAAAEGRKKPGLAERTAERLERRIEQNKVVRYDPSYDIYWSRRGDKDGKFDFATSTPLIAKVGKSRKTRYFGVKQFGQNRKSLDVFPLPAKSLKAQTIYDDYFNCGLQPRARGKASLDSQTAFPEVPVTYLEDDKVVKVSLPLGQTKPYNQESILIPPAIEPDPKCN